MLTPCDALTAGSILEELPMYSTGKRKAGTRSTSTVPRTTCSIRSVTAGPLLLVDSWRVRREIR